MAQTCDPLPLAHRLFWHYLTWFDMIWHDFTMYMGIHGCFTMFHRSKLSKQVECWTIDRDLCEVMGHLAAARRAPWAVRNVGNVFLLQTNMTNQIGNWCSRQTWQVRELVCPCLLCETTNSLRLALPICRMDPSTWLVPAEETHFMA